MKWFRALHLLKSSSVFLVSLGLVQGVFAAIATPGVTIAATNVSVQGQGSGVSNITLTSVNGFTGTVGVTCTGPDSNITPDLLLPKCDHPTQLLTLAANGTATGAISFYPPWENLSASISSGAAGKRIPPSPLTAGVLAGMGLLGFRLRRLLSQRIAVLVGVVCMISLIGVAGCIGHGGLAMTPGTYSYTITASPTLGTPQPVTKTISVTVKCDSCP